MEETQRLKKAGYIGYRFESGMYLMVDFGTGEILSTMDEVAILLDGNMPLKHGAPKLINPKFSQLKELYNAYGILGLHIIQGKIPIDKIDKMLSISGCLPEEIYLNGLRST